MLLVASGASVARGTMARESARSRWAEIEAQRAVAGARVGIAGASWAMARGSPVARIVIPRLGLDEVVVEGVGEAELRAGPGHMSGSVLPGENGTTVISAHRDRHFRALSDIAVGDTILTESAGGSVTWRVARLRITDADHAALREAPTPTLLLTPCWPIRYFGPAPDRLIVEATPIESSRR
jgi:sortase A